MGNLELAFDDKSKTTINVVIDSDFLHKTVHMTSPELLSFFN